MAATTANEDSDCDRQELTHMATSNELVNKINSSNNTTPATVAAVSTEDKIIENSESEREGEDLNHNNNLVMPLEEQHQQQQELKIQSPLQTQELSTPSKSYPKDQEFPSPTPPDLNESQEPLRKAQESSEEAKDLEISTHQEEEKENMCLTSSKLENPLRDNTTSTEEKESDEKKSSEMETEEASSTETTEKTVKDIEMEASQAESTTPTLPASLAQQFGASPVNIEAIKNMQMAIAQVAAKTIANGASGQDNEAAMKQLAFLQQTLFNLQQQQLFQIQLIQQLQSQLAMNQPKTDNTEMDEEEEEEVENGEEDTYEEEERIAQMELRQKAEARMAEDKARQHLINAGVPIESLKRKRDSDNPEDMDVSSSRRLSMDKSSEYALDKLKDMENRPLPFGSNLASSIITHHDDMPEPNSLDLLQKRAQEVLDSASQGILANNMADEFAFKEKNGKAGNEPFFKHRCRYCGKVFGSDSALQIHIRSHTGERPFKCNVCGSRFTTKGNLKVHFQRHAHKFPHVPMNATPIPEHLDKFHPPLLDQMSPDSSPSHTPAAMPQQMPSQMPAMNFPGASNNFPGLANLYRPPMDILKSLTASSGAAGGFSNPFFPQVPGNLGEAAQQAQAAAQAVLNKNQDNPTDLSKTSEPSSPLNTQIKSEICEEKEQEEEQEEAAAPKTAPLAEAPKTQTPPPTDIKIKEEKDDCEIIQDDMEERPHSLVLAPAASSPAISTHSPVMNPLPQVPNSPPVPTSKTPTTQHLPPVVQPIQPPAIMHPQPSPGSQHHFDHLPTPGQLPPSMHHRDDFFAERFPLNFTKTLSPDRHSPIRSPAHIPRAPFFNPMKPHDMALLPRPHSNDNSWENFIEISNSSETMKLKELMKNKKITDPNQCVVCDRVLSCKSALQMHYRTHTGERPFKCRICGRAFTTKGNLKTHMAVHKIRPPMRNFHQCPVCHKKYSNALVLQQHIRLHTGEPTDLTPEQIQAAEIRDPPPSMMPGAFMNPFAAAAFHFGMPGGPGMHPLGAMHNGMGSESSQGDFDDQMDCGDDFDDDMSSDHMSNNDLEPGSERPKSTDDFKGLLFEQKLRIDPTGVVNTNPRPQSVTSNPNSISSPPTSPNSAAKPLTSTRANSPARSASEMSQGALDLTPRAGPSSANSSISARSPLPSNSGKRSPSPLSKSPKLPQISPSSAPAMPPTSAVDCLPPGLHHHLQQQHQQLMQQQAALAAAQHHQQMQHNAVVAMHQEQLRREAVAHAQLSPNAPPTGVNQQQQPPTGQSSANGSPQMSHPPPPNPLVAAARPPFGMFPNLPLFPPASTQNMCTAMNSIAQSVMPAAPFNPLALSGEL